MDEIKHKHPGGRPRMFNSPDQIDSMFMTYLHYCDDNDKMPNIAGFCRFCKEELHSPFHRDTFYEYAKKPEFADAIKSIDECLEDEVLNSKSQRDLIKLAYLNNKCGYSTKTDVNLIAKQEINQDQLSEEFHNLLTSMSDEEKAQFQKLITDGNG